MNDINPTAIARNVLIMAGLKKLGESAPHDIEECHGRNEDAFRAAMFLQYTFFSYAMPPSIFDYQMTLIEELVENNFESIKKEKGGWMVADERVWSQIKGIMQYWRGDKDGDVDVVFPTTEIVLEDHYEVEGDNSASALYKEDTPAHSRLVRIRAEEAAYNRQLANQIKERFVSRQNTLTLDDVGEQWVEAARQQLPPTATDDEVLQIPKELQLTIIQNFDPGDLADMEDGTESIGRLHDEKFIVAVKAILPPRGCARALFDDIRKRDLGGLAFTELIQEGRNTMMAVYQKSSSIPLLTSAQISYSGAMKCSTTSSEIPRSNRCKTWIFSSAVLYGSGMLRMP